MNRLFAVARILVAASAIALAASGCTSLYSHTNKSLPPPEHKVELPPARATLNVSGERGNPKVLMFLSLSGGGSRAAYFSAAAMLKLQTVMAPTDLLAEVDVISAVSGGALAGATYAATRDIELRRPDLALILAPHSGPSSPDRLPELAVNTVDGTIRCSAPLSPPSQTRINDLLASTFNAARAVTALCDQSAMTDLRPWNADWVRERMQRNYLWRWFGSWFLPINIVRYWTTAHDRADIMAQTFADSLFDTPTFGRDLSMADLNPKRPFLILNATNASQQIRHGSPQIDETPFGSVFTFTDEDFRTQLASDIRSYELARAVMAASAFPVVFPAMTLRDYRPAFHEACKRTPVVDHDYCERDRYMHVFDGGNSDNLGLKSIKRVLLQMHASGEINKYDSVIVLLIDAFAVPPGMRRTQPDPRGVLDYFLDLNVTQAVDSLLQLNREALIDEFADRQLKWTPRDCENETRELPAPLCAALKARNIKPPLNMQERLVFYHVGFDDVRDDLKLRERLNRIPTSFTISTSDVKTLDEAVNAIVTPDNPCLVAIAALVNKSTATPDDVKGAQIECDREDVLPSLRSLPQPTKR